MLVDMTPSTAGGNPIASGQRLLTKTDVAELLQVSPRTVENLVNSGRLPKPVYVGRLPRWRPELIHEAFANG